MSRVLIQIGKTAAGQGRQNRRPRSWRARDRQLSAHGVRCWSPERERRAVEHRHHPEISPPVNLFALQLADRDLAFHRCPDRPSRRRWYFSSTRPSVRCLTASAPARISHQAVPSGATVAIFRVSGRGDGAEGGETRRTTTLPAAERNSSCGHPHPPAAGRGSERSPESSRPGKPLLRERIDQRQARGIGRRGQHLVQQTVVQLWSNTRRA